MLRHGGLTPSFRACLGIVRLAKSFGRERVEAACFRALEIGARSYGSVRSILDNKLDRQAAAKRTADGPAIRRVPEAYRR